MSAPENCPKCGVREVYTSHDLKSYACGTLVSASGGFFHTGTCQAFVELRKPLDSERDQLAERVRELEAWKESAMAMEREWDPNQLAAMLGGQLGESQRAVIQWKVPRLVERVKQLEAVVTDPHALWSNWLRGTVKLPAGIGDIRECAEKMKRFRSRWLATHQELRKAEDYIELLKSEKSC